MKKNEEKSRRNSLKRSSAYEEIFANEEYQSYERRMRDPFRVVGRVINIRNRPCSRIPLIDDIPAL